MHMNMRRVLNELCAVHEEQAAVICPEPSKPIGERITAKPYVYWRMPSKLPIGFMLNMYDGKRNEYWSSFIRGDEPGKGDIMHIEGSGSFYHSHAYFEFTYVIDGEYPELVINDDVMLHSGDLTLLDTKSIHRVRTNPVKSDILFLSFSKEYLTEELLGVCCDDMQAFFQTALLNKSESGQVMLLRVNDPVTASKTEGLLADILSELINRNVGYEMVVKGYMARFFSMLANGYEREIRSVPGSEHKLVLFYEISIYIKEHLNTVSIKKLEQRYPYSRNYYNRLFREIAGCSYSEYIRQVRIDRAEELLRNTKISVLDISQMLGYENQAFFSRIFKERFGVTPTEYRTLNSSSHRQE